MTDTYQLKKVRCVYFVMLSSHLPVICSNAKDLNIPQNCLLSDDAYVSFVVNYVMSKESSHRLGVTTRLSSGNIVCMSFFELQSS